MLTRTAGKGGHAIGLWVRVSLCALAVGALGAQATPAVASGGFVGRSGTQLTLDGSPWHPIGWNDYRLPNTAAFACDAGRGLLTDAQMQALFTRWRTESGANVVRTWFFQSYFQADASHPFAAFDRVVSNAAAAGLKVIPVLTNNWPDCESATATRKSVSWYQNGYLTPSDGYTMSFQQYATAVATHYATNTTVAFWQLVNEIDPSGCVVGTNDATVATYIHDFGNTMATDLKAADANHRVSLGTQGSGQCGTNGANYNTAHTSSAIDMCEYHDYGEPARAMPTGNPASTSDTGDGLQTRITQCTALNKPLFVGESGILANIAADGSVTGPVSSATLQRRADEFAAKMQAAFSAGVAGYLIWEGIPEASDSAANVNDGAYGVGPQDPAGAAMLTTARAQGAAAVQMSEGRLVLVPAVGLAVAALALLGWRRRPSVVATRRWSERRS